jgi:hypothetical protein
MIKIAGITISLDRKWTKAGSEHEPKNINSFARNTTTTIQASTADNFLCVYRYEVGDRL